MLDTGSTYTVLSKRIGKKLKLERKPVKVSAFGHIVAIEKAFLASLALGEVVFKQIEVRICQLPDVHGLRIDALIGMNVLKRTSVTFDFEKGDLVLGQVRELPHQIQSYRGLDLVLLTMTVQGRASRLTLDTGACGLILYRDSVQDRFLAHRFGRIEYRSHVGGRTRMEEVMLPAFSLGGCHWKGLRGYLMDRRQSGMGTSWGISEWFTWDLKSFNSISKRVISSGSSSDRYCPCLLR